MPDSRDEMLVHKVKKWYISPSVLEEKLMIRSFNTLAEGLAALEPIVEPWFWQLIQQWVRPNTLPESTPKQARMALCRRFLLLVEKHNSQMVKNPPNSGFWTDWDATCHQEINLVKLSVGDGNGTYHLVISHDEKGNTSVPSLVQPPYEFDIYLHGGIASTDFEKTEAWEEGCILFGWKKEVFVPPDETCYQDT
jgi:hypothetical protein